MFDLSPIRPWEYRSLDLAEWVEMVEIRNIYDAAYADARKSSSTDPTPTLNAMSDAEKAAREAQMTGRHSRRIE